MIFRPGPRAPLELWGGVECTVNRVGEQYFDQLVWSGHATRPDDLDRFAALGLRTLRYPVLWERTAPDNLADADWSWADERLNRLRSLDIRPIVGLVHHGSGPRWTNLCEPSFATGLAAYAGAVAARYPWVTDYTPVNEPLTTSRFSALYGHWYPHQKDDRAWAQAIINQCRATVLAMRAIRAVNPAARLIQTDDLGKMYSTPALAYQAEFENERRWLTHDLLTGRVDPVHRMWQYLTSVGIPADDLHWFRENRCPPDIIGINTYLASVRFIDERVNRYPDVPRGGNGRDAYVDVLATRVLQDVPVGPYSLLREAWERYHCPIAVTESHNAGGREEQLRWLAEVWRASERLHEEGADLRAVTVWSLLGVYNWNVLVTRADGQYEPGVFDLRAPHPRPTAIAGFVQARATGTAYDHPVLDTPGWWRRPERLWYPTVTLGGARRKYPESSPDAAALPPWRARILGMVRGIPADSEPATDVAAADARPILIVGTRGTLGQAFTRLCRSRALAHHALTRAELDITDAEAVRAAVASIRPWAVINAAGYVRVDDAERERDACFRINADGAANLAVVCADTGAALLTFSSDLVFAGDHDTPYIESDAPAPLNAYGYSKAVAEEWVLHAMPHAFIVRTSAFFGPWDRANYVYDVLRRLAHGERVAAANDITVSPTYVPQFVHTCLDLLIDAERGIWHLTNTGATTWAMFAQTIAEHAGYDPQRIDPRPADACGFVATRPAYSVLGSVRGTAMMSPLNESLRLLLRESEVSWTDPQQESQATN